jgi:hypothetical protein
LPICRHEIAGFSLACVGVGGDKDKTAGFSLTHVGVGGSKDDFVRGNLRAMGHVVGTGGVHEAEVRGNGGIRRKEDDGVGGIKSFGRAGVSEFSHINMFRQMIDDRRRMLRGEPLQNIDVKHVHFNITSVGLPGSSLGKHQRQDINRNDDDDVTGGNDVGSCEDEELGGYEEFGGEGLGGVGFGGCTPGGGGSGDVHEHATVNDLVELFESL